MMKNLILLSLIILATSSFAKVVKPNTGGKLNFKFEIPKEETKRSLASDKEKELQKQRNPANQADTEETNQRDGIKFWKF